MSNLKTLIQQLSQINLTLKTNGKLSVAPPLRTSGITVALTGRSQILQLKRPYLYVPVQRSHHAGRKSALARRIQQIQDAGPPLTRDDAIVIPAQSLTCALILKGGQAGQKACCIRERA